MHLALKPNAALENEIRPPKWFRNGERGRNTPLLDFVMYQTLCPLMCEIMLGTGFASIFKGIQGGSLPQKTNMYLKMIESLQQRISFAILPGTSRGMSTHIHI